MHHRDRDGRLPAEVVEQMSGSPEFGFMQGLAHTLPYDAAMSEVVTLPGLARIAVPVLVLDGGNSPESMRSGAKAVADAVPRAAYRTVPGEDHAILQHADVFAAEIRRG